jgi:hypothetical protein
MAITSNKKISIEKDVIKIVQYQAIRDKVIRNEGFGIQESGNLRSKLRFRHLELDEFVIIPDHIHGIIIICANRTRGGTAGDVDIMRLNPLAVPLPPPYHPARIACIITT